MSHSPPHHHISRPSEYGRLIAAILLLCLVAVAGYSLQHTITSFLFSWIIAYLLDPIVMYLERMGLKRVYGLALLYVMLGILTIFFLAFMLPALTIGWDSFIRELPVYIQHIKRVFADWKGRLPARYGSDEIQWILDRATGNIDAVSEKIGALAYGFATRILFNLFNIFLSPILVFFMLYYKDTIKNTITSWLPEHRREMIVGIADEVNGSIGGYIRGQVIVSIIVALCSAIALFVMGIPHPIFCGIFAGASSVLPFIGIIIAVLPAMFFAWFHFQAMSVLLNVGIVFSIIYFLEGYIVKPIVFKGSMNLNPLVTIIMVMALGEMLGFWGILLALPIAAAIKITWRHFLDGDFRHQSHHHHG